MMKMASPLILTTGAAIGRSCAEQDFSSFRSEDLANQTLPAEISQKELREFLLPNGSQAHTRGSISQFKVEIQLLANLSESFLATRKEK